MICLTMRYRNKVHDNRLRESLTEVALGRGVKRTRHDLIVDGIDYTEQFIDILTIHGFQPVSVAGADLEPGERIPAFYVHDATAYFGWIFFEKFTGHKFRKLWGSVIRNGKGDWAIQISPKKDVTLYAALDQKTEMDLERPTDW
jgi:hypothetical protein